MKIIKFDVPKFQSVIFFHGPVPKKNVFNYNFTSLGDGDPLSIRRPLALLYIRPLAMHIILFKKKLLMGRQ